MIDEEREEQEYYCECNNEDHHKHGDCDDYCHLSKREVVKMLQEEKADWRRIESRLRI